MNKKVKIILTSLLSLFLTVGVVSATTQLWEYGTFNERGNLAVEVGIIDSIDDYQGSYNQNIKLLDYYQNINITSGDELTFGGTKPVALSSFNLAGAGISSSDTSMTLTSLTIKQTGQKIADSDLSDTFYVTLEPGNNTKQEISACTTVTQNANGSATLSGCSRGMSPISPYTASTTMAFTHAGGSQVIFSDPPQLYEKFTAYDNYENVTSGWLFTVTPSSTDTCTETTEFCNKSYIDSSVNQGAATSTESVGGIAELATQIEMASSTTWTAADPHVIQSKYASSTPSDGSSGLYVIVSENDGYINQGWLDLSESWIFTGDITFSTGATELSATTTKQYNERGSLVPVGSIQMYVATSSPTGWLLCDGTAVSRTDFSDLYAIIADRYGAGDGSTTFNVPDMRQRVPMGVYDGVADGVGSFLGKTGGATSTNQTIAQMPAHTHGLNGDYDGNSAGGGTTVLHTPGSTETQSTGSGKDMSILDPYITVQYIIKY